MCDVRGGGGGGGGGGYDTEVLGYGRYAHGAIPLGGYDTRTGVDSVVYMADTAVGLQR
jgi:hypothetical protein